MNPIKLIITSVLLFLVFVPVYGQQLRKLQTIGGDLALSPDAYSVAVFNREGLDKGKGNIALYNLSSGELMATLPAVSTLAACFSGDHRKFVTLNGQHEYRLYDLSDDHNPALIRSDTAEKRIMSCAISPDGLYYAIGLENGQLIEFETASGKFTHVYNPFRRNSGIARINYTLNNHMVIYSWEEGYSILDVQNARLVFDIPLGGNHHSTTSTVSASVNRLMLGTDDAAGRVYDLSSGNVLTSFLIPGYDRSYYSADGRYGIGVDRSKLMFYTNYNGKRKKLGGIALSDNGIDKDARLRDLKYSEDGKWFVASLSGGNLLIGNLAEIEAALK